MITIPSSQNPRLVPLHELFASRDAGLSFSHSSINPQQDAAKVTGIHVYADLKLELALAAAETDPKALRYLNILQDLAVIADACAQETGATLLEVQESRVHFLLECERFDSLALGRIVALATSMTQAVYSIIRPKALDAWAGFCMAADHGLAVVLFSDCGGGSAISLGIAANRPAKRLGAQPTVASGHLSIRTDLVRFIVGPEEKQSWVDINVLEPTERFLGFTDSALSGKLLSRARQAVLSRKAATQIAIASSTFFESLKVGSALSPTRLQAFCLRADLDGFTKQVEIAFAEGPEAVAGIVLRFRKILEYPKFFATALERHTILLPWAGDCATILVIPNTGERFNETRKFLPLVATGKWHEQLGTRQELGTPLGDLRWAVGIAAGDQHEGNDGWVLVAELATSNRSFRVSAGWSVRRSNDGCQYDGVRGGDTVLPLVDYQCLDLIYQKGFEDLGSQFKRSNESSRKKAAQDRSAQIAASAATITTQGLIIPKPKPFAW